MFSAELMAEINKLAIRLRTTPVDREREQLEVLGDREKERGRLDF
jgi:hypothetical protein